MKTYPSVPKAVKSHQYDGTWLAVVNFLFPFVVEFCSCSCDMCLNSALVKMSLNDSSNITCSMRTLVKFSKTREKIPYSLNFRDLL